MRDDSSEGEKEKSKSGKDRRRRRNKDVDRKERKGEGSKRDGKKIVKDGDDETADGDLLEGDIVRKKIGLDWMLPPDRKADQNPSSDVEEKFEESVPEVREFLFGVSI